jgi:hypothetical protein
VCDEYYTYPGLLYDGCDDSSYNLNTAMSNYKFQKGIFMSELDISSEFETLIWVTSDNTYGTAWSIWNDIQSGLVRLDETGGIVTDPDAFNAWVDLINSALSDDPFPDDNNDTFSSAFEATNGYWLDVAFTYDIVGGDAEWGYYYAVDMDYEKYFTRAQVTTCTYSTKEGWFDVFIFALNSTQSLFGASVIVFGFVYSLVKFLQGKCSKKGEDEEGNDQNDTELKTQSQRASTKE